SSTPRPPTSATSAKRGSLARAREALQSRDFRLLTAARIASNFGDGIFQAFLIGRLVFLSPEKGTAIGVAKAYAVLIIPFSLLGPFTGVVIDRWSRRRILTLTPLIRAAATLGILALASGPASLLLYALTLVVVSLNRFYIATTGAVLPTLVPEEDLLMGNSVTQATGTVVTFAGLVLGTQIADQIGHSGLLVIPFVLWPISAFIASRIRKVLRPAGSARPLHTELRRITRDLVLGARRLVSTPAALGSITSIAVDQFLIGLITVLSVIVFKEEFNQGVASYGRIVGAGGVGVIVGTATVGLFEQRLEKPRIMALAFGVAGVVGLLVAPRIIGPTVFLMSFTLGLTYPWRKVPADTIVQDTIPDRYRGRVFALYDLAFSLPRVAAAALAIVLIPNLSAGWILAACALVYLLWTPVPVRWIERWRWVEVRFYAGGKADEVPRSVLIGGEEEPVEVLKSWNEEVDRRGAVVRRRRFRLRASDGTRMEIASDENDRWLLTAILPSDEES
ncbi:MAG TPA: MFS transporter, partial [Actinomycetota bacterium]|nr:MFS transporter [Actinomycetota bacterium]